MIVYCSGVNVGVTVMDSSTGIVTRIGMLNVYFTGLLDQVMVMNSSTGFVI
jgi:hypothetical protein